MNGKFRNLDSKSFWKLHSKSKGEILKQQDLLSYLLLEDCGKNTSELI